MGKNLAENGLRVLILLKEKTEERFYQDYNNKQFKKSSFWELNLIDNWSWIYNYKAARLVVENSAENGLWAHKKEKI